MHYKTSDSVVYHDAGEHVRVWYAQEGKNAPRNSAAGPDGTPFHVAYVGQTVTEALDAFSAKGFKGPLADGGYDPCASNGGDGRLDVYLIAFPSGADGSVGVDECTGAGPQVCSGFILLDNNLAGYGTFPEGVNVVAPHELFHLVQKAYTSQWEPWWSEATAQWAADELRPELTDLEGFLPYFFTRPQRALDAPAAGVTNGWLYSTAIWPVFLEQHHPGMVLDVFEQLGAGVVPALEATSEALQNRNRELAAEFMAFASANAATGERADLEAAGAYSQAADYPAAVTSDLPNGHGELWRSAHSGMGTYYFVSREPRRLSIEADQERIGAVAIPIRNGAAVLDASTPLPADLDGESIVVVAGKQRSKVDAPFVLRSNELVEPPPKVSRPAVVDEAISSSCSVNREHRGGSGRFVYTITAFWLCAWLRRRLIKAGSM